MKFSPLARKAERFFLDNSPAIMTAVSVAGAVTTAFLTGKASFKAAELLAEEREYQKDGPYTPIPMEFREKLELVWKLYIPAVSTGVMTITCIVASNRIGTRRAAAMAAAYSFSERAFEQYKEKVAEKLGPKEEEKIRDEIAQDNVDRNPPSHEVIVSLGDEVLCRDSLTGRYFKSTMQAIGDAQNKINHQINNNWCASLSEFYDEIGLPRTPLSDELGWNSDKLLDIRFSGTIADDGRPCISIDFSTVPIRGYHQINYGS